MNRKETAPFRDSTQLLMPSRKEETEAEAYDLYPAFPIGEGKIDIGYQAIAEKIADYSRVMIDGYVGVLWKHFRDKLDAALLDRGISTKWIDMSDLMLPEEQIKELKKPFFGGDDPVFGTRYTGELSDFFDMERVAKLASKNDADLCIVYGCGAGLAGWNAPLVYVDLPKNELQYRSRAGSIANLGMSEPSNPKVMYKEFYFVDWIVLNKHKANLVGKIDWMIDGQRPDEPSIMAGEDFRFALKKMSENAFRVRPWFEPGVWGGQWCKQHIPQLSKNVPNYAWSFEMIVPENGLVLSSEDKLLEISFDWLMYAHHKEILGDSADLFGFEFPIRFDFLDTVDGENLSLQCHPNSDYIKEHFGESFTQDETYYMLDCKPDAQVYLGFQEDIDPNEFRRELEKAAREGTKVDVENYVLKHPARKHDLFLIPSGTIHCSGAGNLVLEISATPYIFTFKMYDWQRLDLDGKPRPINIKRAFDNLQFDRKGKKKIQEEFISIPHEIKSGTDWRLVHLPTHPEHFYDIHQCEFADEMDLETDGSCQIMNLVEGDSIILKIANGFHQRFNFAETFAVPAAAKRFKLINEGGGPAKVVKAFIKKSKV
jgi:mannose-6-phosphate isomerase class I